MKDRAHHGIRFMTGFSLVLALFASACVAGEVGDANANANANENESANEPQAPAARASAPRDEARSPSERYVEDEESEPDEATTEGAVAVPCIDVVHEGRDQVGARHCELGRGAVRFDPVVAQPPKEPEPPPNPW
jgi:hypothetical protein